MANLRPFRPTGPTKLITAAASPPTGVQILVAAAAGAQSQSEEVRIYVRGTVPVTIGWGVSAAAAATAAALPDADGENSVSIPAGAVEVLVFPVGSYFSAYAASSSGVELTPGRGY